MACVESSAELGQGSGDGGQEVAYKESGAELGNGSGVGDLRVAYKEQSAELGHNSGGLAVDCKESRAEPG